MFQMRKRRVNGMTIEKELNDILYERMSREYDDFLTALSAKSPDEIIRASY